MLTHINVMPLYVSDQQASLEFFVDRLGFSRRTEVQTAPGRWWYEIALPGSESAIALLSAADYGREPQAGLTLTLCCDDVPATVAQLRAAGADVGDPVEQPWGTFAELTGPDGHTFVIGDRPQADDPPST